MEHRVLVRDDGDDSVEGTYRPVRVSEELTHESDGQGGRRLRPACAAVLGGLLFLFLVVLLVLRLWLFEPVSIPHVNDWAIVSVHLDDFHAPDVRKALDNVIGHGQNVAGTLKSMQDDALGRISSELNGLSSSMSHKTKADILTLVQSLGQVGLGFAELGESFGPLAEYLAQMLQTNPLDLLTCEMMMSSVCDCKKPESKMIVQVGKVDLGCFVKAKVFRKKFTKKLRDASRKRHHHQPRIKLDFDSLLRFQPVVKVTSHFAGDTEVIVSGLIHLEINNNIRADGKYSTGTYTMFPAVPWSYTLCGYFGCTLLTLQALAELKVQGKLAGHLSFKLETDYEFECSLVFPTGGTPHGKCSRPSKQLHNVVDFGFSTDGVALIRVGPVLTVAPLPRSSHHPHPDDECRAKGRRTGETLWRALSE